MANAHEPQPDGLPMSEMPSPTDLSKAAMLRLKGDRSVRDGDMRKAVRHYQKSLRLTRGTTSPGTTTASRSPASAMSARPYSPTPRP